MKPALVLLLGALAASPLAAAGAVQPPALAGDLPLEGFPESATIRAAWFDAFLAAPRREALALPEARLAEESRVWRRSSIDAGESFYLVFSPERGGSFPLHGQGTWIVKRARSDGRFIQAKVFLRSDPGTFVRIYPDGSRCRLDVVAYGGVLNREVPLPLPFERVLKSRFSDIVAWTADTVDWEPFSPRPGQYGEVRALVDAIRAELPGLRYADDGALDAAGKPVYIATGLPQAAPAGLNCSGFAKWIVDGLSVPLGAPLLDPRALAERHPELRGSSFNRHLESALDPYFGLDWTRNLGRAWADTLHPARRHGATEADVTEEPFALLASARADPVNGGSAYEDYPARGPETGYEIRGLEPLLFVLASRDPGALYLASISGRKDGGPRLHYHLAVLAPWFDEGGIFRVAVFESAAETSLAALVGRAPRESAFLVRLQARAAFNPPPLP